MNETKKKNSNQIISDFLTNNKMMLLIVLAVIIVVVVAFGIFSSVSTKNVNEVLNSTTELDRLYDEVNRDEGTEEDFVNYANKLITDFSGTKAEIVSYSRLASYFYDKKDYEKANEYYTLAFTKFPEDIAASIYMFNSAMSLEELNRVDEAIVVLQNLVTIFKSSNIDVADRSADVPEAIFNLGRMFESKNDTPKAKEQYEILVAEYKSQNLSNLAKSRLLTLK